VLIQRPTSTSYTSASTVTWYIVLLSASANTVAHARSCCSAATRTKKSSRTSCAACSLPLWCSSLPIAPSVSATCTQNESAQSHVLTSSLSVATVALSILRMPASASSAWLRVSEWSGERRATSSSTASAVAPATSASSVSTWCTASCGIDSCSTSASASASAADDDDVSYGSEPSTAPRSASKSAGSPFASARRRR
jgi:hypothetical protein